MKGIYLILACICNTLFRYKPFFFEFGNPAENHTSYAVGQALSYIFLLLYGQQICSQKETKCLFFIAWWCAISNLLDELFFNPLQLGINELLFAVFIVFASIHLYFKKTVS